MSAARLARSALLALLALAAAADAGAAARGREAPELDRTGFVDALNRLSEALRDGGDRPGDLPALRRGLPAVWALRIDGRRYEVPTAWLDDGLKIIEDHPSSRACVARDLRARLTALRTEARGLAGAATTPSLAQARARLDAILKQREFRGIGPPGLMTQLFERLIRFIADELGRFFKVFGLDRDSGEALVWILIAVALAVAAVGLGRVLRRSAPGRAAPEATPAAARATWRESADQALRAARDGACGEAVRLAYAAALLRLDDLGVWDLDTSRTHREYLRLLPAEHELRSPFQVLVGRFELIVYGRRHATEEDGRETVGFLERLECAAPSMPATGRS